MSEHKEPVDKATEAGELEPVEVKPRSARGAVISVRLSSEEAQAVATRAQKAGLTLSDFARRLLRRSIASTWRVMVWDGQAPVVIGVTPQTGGDYNRRSGELAPGVSG